MKVSRTWLQKYFDAPLPDTEELVDALTFHSSEVEEVLGEGDAAVMDVKILPDRAPYALSHRGIAYELGAALGWNLKEDPLREALPKYDSAANVHIHIADREKCTRYMAGVIRGVKVGPSPEWLKDALSCIGARSINNVVDATNYVMLNIGQPLHAFDLSKFQTNEEGAVSVSVRGSREGEKITTLTGEEYALPVGTLLIAEGSSDAPLGIAGMKGGKAAEITDATTDILIESANFDGTSVRKTSQALKLWTDASLRFQNKISPELAAYGMRDVLALILLIAGGSFEGVTDEYPSPAAERSPISCALERLNGFLGTSFSIEDITGAFDRLNFEYVVEGETVTIRPSFERSDLNVWQDIAEEAGRILGYDSVEPASLPMMPSSPDQKRFAGIERIKDLLVERGFTEISTQSFTAEGEVRLENPLQQERPWLRASLKGNMEEALARAATVAPRVLGPEPALKLFELGSVFAKDGEYLSIALGYRQLSGKPSAAVLQDAADALLSAFPGAGIERTSDTGTGVTELSLKNANLEFIGEGYGPVPISLTAYRPFSLYPAALRDIAIWTPDGTQESEVALVIQQNAGDLLARMDLFDRFDKDGRTSYAYRLVFQANDRTLADTDIDPVMNAMTDSLNAQEGWEVR